MTALRCWVSAWVLVAVAGCSATAPRNDITPPARTANSQQCEVFVDAWVNHFRASVAQQDGQRTDSLSNELRQSREVLAAAGQDEMACQLPFCIIQPKAGGRLDSYCGYRVADPSGQEMYRWVPWAPSKR